jgi:hypothetical protein
MNIVHNFATALSALIIGQVVASDAAASVVNLDEFAVVRDGITIFDDSFNRNTTLNGGAGTQLPSGMTFPDGSVANYLVQGSVPVTTANNGQAQFNTANGILILQPPPSIPLIQNVNMGLITGTNATAPNALTPANNFSAIGLIDFAVPSAVLGTYQFYLGNNRGSANPGVILHMRLRETDTGPVLQFQWVDNINGQNTITNQVALTPAELAEPQLEFEISHNIADGDVVVASYAFGSGNTLASFTGTLTELGRTDSSTDIFTSTLNWAQPGFEAFDPVAAPEPSSLAILAAGLLGLAALRPSRK